MAQTVSKGALERKTALARLEVEQLNQQLANFTKAAATGDVLRQIQGTITALARTLDVPIGLTVAQAAEVLNVSKPPVSKWMNETLLEQLPARTPAEVTPISVLRLSKLLTGIREEFPARLWTTKLAAFLHDRDLQAQDW